jgi:hypothetical protein
MSSVRRHCCGVISIAWTHPTTPAKQSRISMECLVAAASKARVTAEASVTSTAEQMIFAVGKSVCRASMASSEVSKVERRSKRVRLASPCSNSARAAAKARVPAPPVTNSCISFFYHPLGANRYDSCDQHVLTALPSTAKRAIALPSALR